LDRLRALGVEPADVTTVVCTHLHIDHVGWNTSLEGAEWRPTFPRAEYVFARAEYDDHAPRLDQLSADGRASMEDSVAPIAEGGLATLVDVDHELNTQIRLVPTTGHTSGHVSVAIDSQGERALISGDLLYHPCQLAFPEWSTSADDDPELAASTRRRVLAELA